MTFENAVEAAEFISSKYPHPVRTAIVLGSGLGAFADELENAVRIPYTDIPHFVMSTVEGHAGQLLLGNVAGRHVAVHFISRRRDHGTSKHSHRVGKAAHRDFEPRTVEVMAN